MKRTDVVLTVVFAVAAIAALGGCPGILGIEEGVLLTPGDGGDADGGGDDAAGAAENVDGAPRTDADADGASGPAIVCSGGLSACGDRCVDLSIEPKHCGGCDRDCGNAPCSGGVCPAQLLVDQMLDSPERLLVDANGLYWTSKTGVTRSNLDGSTLSTDTVAPPTGGFVMDNDALYWATGDVSGGAIFTKPKGLGSSFKLLDLGTSRPYGLAIDPAAKTLFFANLGMGSDPVVEPSFVAQTPSDHADLTALGTVQVKFLRGIAIDAAFVYAISRDTGALVKVPRVGGGFVVVAQGFVDPEEVVVDGGFAYVLDAGDPYAQRKGAIVRVALSDGTKTPLAVDLDAPAGLVEDRAYVYFTTMGTLTNEYEDGTVWRVPVASGPVVALAKDQPDPRGVAVDMGFVYWANHGTMSRAGSISRVTK